MTRLERTLDLLDSYDRLSATALENYFNSGCKRELLVTLQTDLRIRKAKLEKELIEHGCRRRRD